MKKVIGLLILVMVFAFGFGAGQYFYEKGLTMPGLAMASAKPKITIVRVTEFDPGAPHQWGVFIHTDRPIDAVQKKGPDQSRTLF